MNLNYYYLKTMTTNWNLNLMKYYLMSLRKQLSLSMMSSHHCRHHHRTRKGPSLTRPLDRIDRRYA